MSISNKRLKWRFWFRWWFSWFAQVEDTDWVTEYEAQINAHQVSFCICICIEDQMNAHQFFFFMLITTISMMIIQWPILISYCCFCPSLVSTSGTRCLIFHRGDQCLLTNYLWVLNIWKCLSLSFSTLQDLTGDAVKTETKKTVIKSKLREIMRTVGYLFIW